MTTTQSRHTPYPIRVYFTRKFIKGSLKGMIHHDSLGFVNLESASTWINGIKAKIAKGKMEWEFADLSFQNYLRA